MTSVPLADRVISGDPRAIARAISIVESGSTAAAALVARLHAAAGHAYVIGITGPPGAGKSTLVDRLIREVRAAGLSVGVLAVDPTSPFTGGAILGDRVRMHGHSADEGVFIRSMATRGHLGGLSRATADAVTVLDAAGKDAIIIETVGVGQDEVDVTGEADIVIVVLVPGAGDDVQAIKAGIMEIADVFVVNKADREGADRLVGAIEANLALQMPVAGTWVPPILKTEAHTGAGLRELWDTIGGFRESSEARRIDRQRQRQASRLRSLLADRLVEQAIGALPTGGYDAVVDRIMAREVDPYTAAESIAQQVLPGGAGAARSVAATPGEKPAHQPQVTLTVQSIDVGHLRLTTLHDGPFRLDGGAMFGVVPRVLWEKKTRPDERHRIQLAMRPLLVEADWGRMLIDCGAGDKMSAKDQDIYAFDRSRALDQALAEAGLSAEDVNLVLATHLHFDHFGGATARSAPGLQPRFPNARYLIRRAEWEDATHPHERNRASYLQDDFVPLQAADVVTFHEGDGEVRPGVRVERTGGHTGQHQIVYLESGGRTAVFVADLIPTTAHLQDAWVMGYDLFPVETLMFKKRFIREAIAREYLIVFEHDPQVAAGYIREQDGRRYVERVI